MGITENWEVHKSSVAIFLFSLAFRFLLDILIGEKDEVPDNLAKRDLAPTFGNESIPLKSKDDLTESRTQDFDWDDSLKQLLSEDMNAIESHATNSAKLRNNVPARPELSSEHAEMLSTLRRQVFEDRSAMRLRDRARACGLELSDAQLVRWLRSALWQLNFPEARGGDPLWRSIEGTIAWRESKGLWNRYMFDSAARRAQFRSALGQGLFFAVPAGPLRPPFRPPSAAAATVAEVASPPVTGTPFFARPAAISSVPDDALDRVGDLVLYTLERCELNALRAGFEGAGVLLYIDCENCSLNTLRRWAVAVSSLLFRLIS